MTKVTGIPFLDIANPYVKILLTGLVAFVAYEIWMSASTMLGLFTYTTIGASVPTEVGIVFAALVVVRVLLLTTKGEGKLVMVVDLLLVVCCGLIAFEGVTGAFFGTHMPDALMFTAWFCFGFRLAYWVIYGVMSHLAHSASSTTRP